MRTTCSPHSTGVSQGENGSHQGAPHAPPEVCGASKSPQILSTEQPPRGSATQVPHAQPPTPAGPEPVFRDGAQNHRSKDTNRPRSARPHLGNKASLSSFCLPGGRWPQPPRHMPSQPCQPARHHLQQHLQQLWLRTRGPTYDPSCSGKSPCPVSYSSWQEPSYDAPR